MIIEIGKFKLTSNGDKFHLSELKQVEKSNAETKVKTGEFYEKEIPVGYDMRLETAIRYITDRHVNDLELTVSWREYLELYKAEVLKIQTLLKV